MKSFKHIFKLSIPLTVLMVFITSTVSAAGNTYYSSGNTDPNTLTHWHLNINGTGATPANFTNAADIFIVQTGNTYTMNAIWTISGSLQILTGGTLSTGATNTWTMTIGGTTSVTGTLTLNNNATKTFTGAVAVNSGGILNIPGTAKTVNMSSNLTVASGGTLNHNVSYDNATIYLQVNGDLDLSGTYSYGVFLPAIWMNGAAGTHHIRTGTTSVCKLFLRTGDYYANGPVTVDQDFYPMWNQVGGSFHTNGQIINANWGVVISGGTVYVDGGVLTVGNSVGGMLVGRTLTMNGDLEVSSGTLNITGGGIYLGTPASASPVGTCTQSGGTINAALTDIGQNCTFTQSGGINNSSTVNLNYSTSKYNQTTGTPTLNVAGNLNNNGILSTGTGTDLINIGGSWVNNLTFTTSSTNTVTFNGSGTSNIGGSASSVFNNLTINNAAGVTMSKDQTVNSTLTLTSGILNIGSNNLILPTTALAVAGGPFSASNMIEADGTGTVRKNFSAIGSYFFPIGDNTTTPEYSPITLSFTSGTFAAGAYAAVNVTDAKHPNNASSTDYLTRYWTLSNSGISSPSYTATATYLTSDVVGTEANIAGAKYTGSLPWTKYGVIGSNTLTTTAITSTGGSIAITGISNIPPIVSISGGGVTICPGSTTASLSSAVTNATSSISYLWSPGVGLNSSTISNPVANPALTTTYTLTVTDGNGFTGSDMTTITVGTIPSAPTITAGGPLTFCTGGSVTLTSSAGTTYLWSTGATTASISPTVSGSYTVQVTNASGCQSAASAAKVVTVNTLPATPTITAGGPLTFCTGGSVTLTSSAGTTYLWSTGATTASISPTVSGSYTVQVTNASGCQSAASAASVVTVNTLPATPTITAGGPLTFCTGGSVTLTSSAGTTYLWSTGATTASISPTVSGSYTVQVTNASGCQSAASAAKVVTVNTLPATPTITAGGPLTFCTGGSVTLTSSAGTTYLWSTGATTASISPTVSGSYTVQVTNASGCQSAASAASVVTVNTLPATPTITAGGPLTFCTGGSVTLTSSAGTTYLWSTGATTASISPTVSGSYTVQVTNASGCQSAASAAKVVTVNTLPATPTITAGGPLTFCTGGSVTLTSSAGTTYLWSTGATTASISPTVSGSYTVQVTNASGCQSAASAASVVTVNTLPATPTITAGGPLTFCTGGSVTLTSSAGTTYLWSTGATTASISPTVSGSYTVQVTNASGCQSAASAASVVTVNTLPATPTITAGGPLTFCTGGSVTLTSSAGTTYLWSTGATTASISPTVSGSYTVQVTNASGCQSAASAAKVVTVNTLPATPTITAGGPLTFCTGGSVTLTSSAGTTYLWSTGATTASISPTVSGSYTVQVTNASGCQSAASAASVVTVNTLPATPTITAGGPLTFCTGGSVTLTSSAGTTYLWSTGATTASISPTVSGSYTVQVTNASGCQSAASAAKVVTVNTLPATPTITAGGPLTFCTGGSVTLTSSAGTTYLWSTGATTASISPTVSGSYTVQVTNASGCQSAASAAKVVTVNTRPTGVINGTASICNGSSNNLTLTVTGTGAINGTLSDGTTFSGTAPTITVSIHPISNTTYTIATLNNGTCSAIPIDISGSAVITVTTPPSATISYATPFCANIGSATVTLTGTSAGTFSSAASINSSTGTVDLVSTAPGAYTITYTIAASGGCAIYTTTTSIVINPNTWTGGISTDWNTAGNWAANAVPILSCPDVTILSGVPYQPTLGYGTFAIGNLYINTGAYLTVSNATLQISGTINNSGTFDASNGTIEMNGSSAQTIPANTFQNNALHDLIISNTNASGVTLGGALDIYGSLTYSSTGMKLTTNDNLTFKSTAAGTAWLGDMTGNTITGKATVERYLLSRKGWRFLSIPTNTTQTIRQTWQEGAASTASNPVPGYGIQLSGAGGTGAGFDLYSATPSMKTYNSSTNTWVGVSGTGINIQATTGYMVFVRGDRTANAFNSPVTQTTLRTKGPVYTGNQTAITVNAGQFTAIGNPYPSTIDMRNITKTGVKDFFYVWDAALAGAYGYGAYQTFSNNGSGNYVITPGGGSYGSSGSISNYIQSGQAFFVQGDVGGGSLVFKEAAKTTGSGVVSIAPSIPTPQIRANLYGVNADSSTYVADGLLINYDDNYSNNVDDLDAIKQTNTSENLSVKTSGKLLVIERRHTITEKDTIFLNLTGVSARRYRFEFLADELYKPGLTAFLLDNYLHTSTPLYVDGTTDIDFSVTGTAASSVPNRFMIVFSQLGTLPVTFTSVKAYSKDKNINVQWTVDNEMNMKQYETEKSTDGNQFSNLFITAATANGGHSANYLVTDTHPVQGYNYYRIKSVDINGKAAYSNIVKVMTGAASGKQEISVYPNPVVNGVINLQLSNQPQGNYGIRLLNKSGQTIIQKQIEHTGGSITETISPDKYLPRGIYQLEVTKPDESKLIINLVY